MRKRKLGEALIDKPRIGGVERESIGAYGRKKKKTKSST